MVTAAARRPRLALCAHAKVNLTLQVLGSDSEGYHQIRTRYQAISLHDLLLVSPAGSTTLSGGFPDDLVLRSSRILEQAAGRPLPASFRLIKRIPAGAGLGGGSSDAAAALRALARLYRLEFDLGPVAAAVGADVPFFLAGGAMEGSGRGERLRPVELASGWFALAWPGFGVSTAAAYRAWDRIGGEGANELARAALDVEPRLAAFARQLGPGWRMTGSGTAFFRLTPTRKQAEAAVAPLRCWTSIARPVGRWGGDA